MPITRAVNPRFHEALQKPSVGARLRVARITEGLRGFWPMLEGAGSLISDYTSGSAPAALSNKVAWSPSAFGGAVNLAVSGSTIDAGGAAPLKITGSVSMSCWVYTNQAPAAGVFPRIISKLQSSTFNGYEMVYAATDVGGGVTPGAVYFQCANAGSLNSMTDTAVLPLGRWVHYVVTFNSTTGVAAIYRDGVLRNSNFIGGGANAASTQTLTIGSHLGFGDTHRFQGSIDLPAVWARDLSAAEAALLYSNPFVLFEPQSGVLRGYVESGNTDPGPPRRASRGVTVSVGTLGVRGRVKRSPVPQPPPAAEQTAAPRHLVRLWRDTAACVFGQKVWRTGPVLPGDQTPIMPPARRKSPPDRMPVHLGNRIRRGTPKPDFVADPPAVMKRRTVRSFDFQPPPGRVRRGRPILNEIGPSTPIAGSRRIHARIIPMPGRVRRGRVPTPDPEPQVLPPTLRRLRSAPPPPPIRSRFRKVLLSALPSPPLPPPCPYRPHRDDQAEQYLGRQPDAADSFPRRSDEGDSTPSRVDECQ